jgi:Rrf2 family protein
MSRNTQFPVAIHILVALTLRDEWLNSEALAWSIGTNASLVRRLLLPLNRAGFITSRPGPTGGVKLAQDPRDISLLEVLRAVEVRSSLSVHEPNPECPLGAILGGTLRTVLDEAEEAAERVLASKNVHEVAQEARREIARRAKKSGGTSPSRGRPHKGAAS